MQPGVADAGIEQLVEDKVDLFWRGMESGAANKKGKVLYPYMTCGLRLC